MAEDRLKIEQTQRDSIEKLRQRNKELEEQLRKLCESQVRLHVFPIHNSSSNELNISAKVLQEREAAKAAKENGQSAASSPMPPGKNGLTRPPEEAMPERAAEETAA